MGKNNGQKTNQTPSYPIVYLVPLIAVLTFIPLIVNQKNVTTGLQKYDWFSGSLIAVDFFLKTKSFWLFVSFGLILFLTMYMVLSEQIKLIWDRSLIPLLLYGAFCLISTFFSIDKTYSVQGIYEQYESVWMLLGYVLLVYFSFYNLHTERAVKALLPWFVAGIVLMTIVGLFQVAGHDLIQMDWMQKIIITEEKMRGKIKLSFGTGRTYMTLYNPNYVGFYGVLAVPMLIVLLINARKYAWKIFYGILTACLLVCVFASQSRAGILTLAGVIVLLLLCMRKVFFKKWYVPAGLAVVAVIAFFGINQATNNALLSRLQGMFQYPKESYALESIVTDKDVTFTIKGNEIHITEQIAEGGQASFTLLDQDGKTVSSQTDASGVVTVNDDRFPMTIGTYIRDNFKGFYVETTLKANENGDDTPVKKQWIFTNQLYEGDDTYYVKSAGASLFHMKKQKDGQPYLEGHYSLADYRGYIWAKTWNILKKYPIFGSGPDTFMIAFPNDDLVGLYNAHHDNEIISKPHCLYLQIAAQTGIPSMIAFIVFFGWYIVSSFKIYWKQDFSSDMSKIGAALLVSIIGYLIMGLTNDSCIAVAPIFFVLAGMGLGVNRYMKQTTK